MNIVYGGEYVVSIHVYQMIEFAVIFLIRKKHDVKVSC